MYSARLCIKYLITCLQNRPEYGITKRSYVEAVLHGLKQYKEKAGQLLSEAFTSFSRNACD